jgi:hypothetical protein
MKNKTIKKIKFKPFYCTTSGDGYWSEVENRKVKVTDIYPEVVWDKYITFRADFDTKNWKVNRDGLIYTDSRWLREFRQNLIKLGLPKNIANSIDYTEQGMQGNSDVSLETSNNKFVEFMGWEFEKED